MSGERGKITRATDASEEMTALVNHLMNLSRDCGTMFAERIRDRELVKQKEKAHRVRNELLRKIARLEAQIANRHEYGYDGDQDVTCSCGANFGAGDGYISVDDALAAAAEHARLALESAR